MRSRAKREKEDALFGVSVSRLPRGKHCVLKHPPQALLSFQNFASRHKRHVPQHKKQNQRTETSPSSSRVEENDVKGFGDDAASTPLNFSMSRFPVENIKTLTCALVAEQSRTSPARSGSSAALERVCMAEGFKTGSKAKKKQGKRRRKRKAPVVSQEKTTTK